MKKFGLAGFVAALLIYALICMPATTQAAACSDVSNFGAVDMTLPVLPTADTHTIWVRMQSPTSSGNVLIELNHSNCLGVGSSSLIPNQWIWLSYNQTGPATPLKFPKLNGNTLRVIGIEE